MALLLAAAGRGGGSGWRVRGSGEGRGRRRGRQQKLQTRVGPSSARRQPSSSAEGRRPAGPLQQPREGRPTERVQTVPAERRLCGQTLHPTTGGVCGARQPLPPAQVLLCRLALVHVPACVPPARSSAPRMQVRSSLAPSQSSRPRATRHLCTATYMHCCALPSAPPLCCSCAALLSLLCPPACSALLPPPPLSSLLVYANCNMVLRRRRGGAAAIKPTQTEPRLLTTQVRQTNCTATAVRLARPLVVIGGAREGRGRRVNVSCAYWPPVVQVPRSVFFPTPGTSEFRRPQLRISELLGGRGSRQRTVARRAPRHPRDAKAADAAHRCHTPVTPPYRRISETLQVFCVVRDHCAPYCTTAAAAAAHSCSLQLPRCNQKLHTPKCSPPPL